MVRSMFSGVSGLRNHQVKMDVIGNNIANVNTQGFKASRTSFKEMFNQTLRGASGPSPSLGGLNPMQVGLGVTTSAIDVLFSGGGTQTTDRTLDLAIQGDGFFAVKQGEQVSYTRSGNLYLDANGYLITSGGQFVQGYTFLGEESYLFDGAETGVKFGATMDDVLGEIGGEEEPVEDGFRSNMAIPMDFTNISISVDGKISGIDKAGLLKDIGMIPLATFVNPAGLDRVGDNLYKDSKNAGIPVFRMAGQGKGAGDLKSGALEMSNVDLSKEFTEMIVTQRGFQANSRVITVSDTLLEELINLKR